MIILIVLVSVYVCLWLCVCVVLSLEQSMKTKDQFGAVRRMSSKINVKFNYFLDILNQH